MALTKSFEDSSGNYSDNSYWRVTQINIDSLGGSINVTFLGWKDAEAFENKKAPLIGAVKNYRISGQEFLAVAMSAPEGETLYNVLAHATESFALAKLDTPVNGEDKSFFDGALQS